VKKTFFKGNRAGSYVQIKLDTDQVERIQQALMAGYITRVGILGSKTNRKKTVTTKKGLHKAGKESAPQTNAEIGLQHEKGSLTGRIPRRSFLEMPLVTKSRGLQAIRTKIWQAFTAGDQTKIRLKQAYVELGHMAERIVQAAFESRGFGQWPINSKTGKGTLIDTGQLRRSITSDVVAK
jgi:hypothetical protein